MPPEKKNLLPFFVTLRRYAEVFRWLMLDSLWRFKLKSAVILSAGFFGITSQAAAIGQAIYYVRLLEKNENFNIFRFTFQTKSSVELFVIFSGGVAVWLFVSALLIYYSRLKINNLRRIYEIFCSQRVLELFGFNFQFHSPNGEISLEDKIILRTARRDSNFCGRVLQMLLEAVVPFIISSTALIILLYIRLDLTLLLICLMGATSIIQYRINKTGAQMSSQMESSIAPATQEKRELIKRFKGLSVHPSGGKQWIHDHFEQGATKQNLDAAEKRRIATEKSKLVSNILFSVVVLFMLLIIGTSSFRHGGGWTTLVVYLVTLRFCFSNFQNVISKLTSINRFYPQFRRYFQFINSTRDQDDNIEPPTPYVDPSDSAPICDDFDIFELKKGQCLGLLSTSDLSRYSISSIVESLLSPQKHATHSILQSSGFVVSTFGCLPFSIRNSVGFTDDFSWNDIRADYEKSGLSEELGLQISRLFDKPVSIERWQQIDPNLKFVLGALSLIKYDFRWIFFDGKGIQALPPLTQSWLIKKCSNRKCIIVYTKKINISNNYTHDRIGVIDPLHICRIACGSEEWYVKNQESIHENLKLLKITESSDKDENGIIDEELEMEDM